jgi:hypothetical protein
LHFLKKIDREVPNGLAVHVITDNYGTRGHDNVQAWLAKHFHFTPTSSSWLNLVERWLRELTQKAIRRGVFRSVPDLVAAIYAYLDAHNADPKPFVWTASAQEILEKVRRAECSTPSSKLTVRHSASRVDGQVYRRSGRRRNASRLALSEGSGLGTVLQERSPIHCPHAPGATRRRTAWP